MQNLNIENFQIVNLKERVKALEDKVFKKSKKQESTRAQQMLILKHLGILEKLEELKVNKKEKAELLSALLNVSAENIEDDLTTIHSNNSPLITKRNYEFLVKTFETVGLDELKEESEKILDSLYKKG